MAKVTCLTARIEERHASSVGKTRFFSMHRNRRLGFLSNGLIRSRWRCVKQQSLCPIHHTKTVINLERLENILDPVELLPWIINIVVIFKLTCYILLL